jgi:hypothetical protein
MARLGWREQGVDKRAGNADAGEQGCAGKVRWQAPVW